MSAITTNVAPDSPATTRTVPSWVFVSVIGFLVSLGFLGTLAAHSGADAAPAEPQTYYAAHVHEVQVPGPTVTKVVTRVVTRVVQAPPVTVTKVVQAPTVAPKVFEDGSTDAGECLPGAYCDVYSSTPYQEDGLPQYLTEWADSQDADLVNVGDYDGHALCWSAQADTTRYACPDGFTTTS